MKPYRPEDTVDGSDFLEYLELQDSLDLVSKSELLDAVRQHGRRVSDRQLTSYITEGLVPRSARIGSRSGAFPKITIDLLRWISDARGDRSLSVEAVRELLPLWRLLQRGVRDRRIDLAEVQLVAQQHVRKPEAVFSVPWVVQSVLPCPACSRAALDEMTFVYKDGAEHIITDGEFSAIGFVAEKRTDADDCPQPIAWMRIDLTPVDRDDPSAIVLAMPNVDSATEDDADKNKVYAGGAASVPRPEAPEMN